MSENITKTDIANDVAKAAEIPTTVAATAVNTVFDSITNHMADGKIVTIAGFGSFNPVKRAARKGRNPATGEAMDFPAKTVPKWRPGKRVKDAVAGAK